MQSWNSFARSPEEAETQSVKVTRKSVMMSGSFVVEVNIVVNVHERLNELTPLAKCVCVYVVVDAGDSDTSLVNDVDNVEDVTRIVDAWKLTPGTAKRVHLQPQPRFSSNSLHLLLRLRRTLWISAAANASM
jgi:hypothetical protein